MPTTVLSGAAAAAATWINSVGNLSGFVGPYLSGFVRDQTNGSMFFALLLLSFAALVAGFVTFYVAPRKSGNSLPGGSAPPEAMRDENWLRRCVTSA